MKTVFQIMIISLLFFSFFITCKKSGTAKPVVFDTDALAFIDSSGISDTVQKVAINNLVIQLKKASLWNKFQAVYPMTGGTANTMKWNLVNPKNTDEAYRLTFHGSPAFSTSGVLFPAISDYADTHLTDSVITYNDNAISFYSNTQNSQNGFDMGCSDTLKPYNTMAIYNVADSSVWFGLLALSSAPAVTKGLFVNSSTANDVKRYENGTIKNTRNRSPTIYFTNLPIRIGALDGATYMAQRQCGFATIGRGLSNDEVLSLTKIVHDYETELGRY
jgi:hypothetical protein